MRLLTFLLLGMFAVTFTSCFEESSSLLSPEFENETSQPLSIGVPTQPSDLVGQQFSMADISLKRQNRPDENFSMSGCLLSVLEDECNTDCPSRIDEDGSTLFFNNSYYNRAGTAFDGIRFARTSATGSGMFASFLLDEVLPLLENADWAVARDGNDFVLTCSGCNINRHGTIYTDRVIRLRP